MVWWTMVDRGWPWWTMVGYGRPWSAMVDNGRPCLTMVERGVFGVQGTKSAHPISIDGKCTQINLEMLAVADAIKRTDQGCILPAARVLLHLARGTRSRDARENGQGRQGFAFVSE